MSENCKSDYRCSIRPVIYQIFPRILTNDTEECVPGGSLQQNGCGKFKDISARVLKSISDLGVNTIWLTGAIEMATKSDFSEFGIMPDNPEVVKGEAGSPYAIKDYYDVSTALAVNPGKRIEEFKALVGRIHKAGMKVIIDFVPNHTARNYNSDIPTGAVGIGAEDDTALPFSATNDYYYIPGSDFRVPGLDGGQTYKESPAKATGNDCFSAEPSQNDWYETTKLNYGRDYCYGSGEHFEPQPLWYKMLDILKYWASLGVDGFRCDMVFMVPLPFWHRMIPMIKKEYPELIFIGEIYDVNQYRPFLDYGCFDYLYDKVNLYDTLAGIVKNEKRADALTGTWQCIDGIGGRMLNFLENHDEVRLASDFFAGDPQKGFPAAVVSACFSSGPFMLYYGQELGERGMDAEGFSGCDGRTTIFDYWSVDSLRRWYAHGKCDGTLLLPEESDVREKYSRLLRALNSSEALRCGSFFDLTYANYYNPGFDPARHFAYLRHCEDETAVVIANFGSEAAEISVNVPQHALDSLRLQPGEYKGREILGDCQATFTLKPDEPLKISLPAYGAAILSTKRKKTYSKLHLYNIN